LPSNKESSANNIRDIDKLFDDVWQNLAVFSPFRG